MSIDQQTAAQFAAIALGHVTREYPNKLDHVLGSADDAATPRALHPVFYGSFDWHSCVHGWWLLLRLRRIFPDADWAREIAALADATFTPEKIAVECAYIARPEAAGFERPYGWAWLFALHREAWLHADRDWERQLRPLAHGFAERLAAYLPLLTYPITTGTHFNTSFALILAHDWARDHAPELAGQIADWACARFSSERDYRGWEPDGDAFLSPALTLARLMSQLLDEREFADWFDAFLPDDGRMDRFEPVVVSDRSDGKIAHLDGLNLTRAWCLRGIAHKLGRHARAGSLRDRAQRHLESAMPHVAGDYAGEHWLATYATLALLAEVDSVG